VCAVLVSWSARRSAPISPGTPGTGFDSYDSAICRRSGAGALWIPQIPIAVGASVLAVAMLDSVVRFIQDGRDSACDLGAGSE
jgi:hypothetical protein